MTPTRYAPLLCLLGLLTLGGSAAPQGKKPSGVYTDPKLAGPDYLVQGEYESAAGGKSPFAVQVVALGAGKFDAYLLGGGLPGAGWDRKTRIKASAETKNGKTVIAGKWTGEIDGGKLTGRTPSGEKIALKRVERHSPTLGVQPPAGAVVLFDGKGADEWQGGKLVEGDLLNCGTRSKKPFGLGRLHLEFRTPFQPKARGQGRGNSGVYLHGREIQVLDSFGLEGKNNECGGFYGAAKPAENMCYPPLAWQTYDVDVRPGEQAGMLLVTVRHNGVTIHQDYPIKGTAKGATINLQNHGNPVVYRNIWIAPAPAGK